MSRVVRRFAIQVSSGSFYETEDVHLATHSAEFTLTDDGEVLHRTDWISRKKRMKGFEVIA